MEATENFVLVHCVASGLLVPGPGIEPAPPPRPPQWKPVVLTPGLPRNSSLKTSEHDTLNVTGYVLSISLKIVLLLARFGSHKHNFLCVLLLSVYIFL